MSKMTKLWIAAFLYAVPVFLYSVITPHIPAVSAFGAEVNLVINRMVSVCWTLVISSPCFLTVKVIKGRSGLTRKNFVYGFYSIGWIMLIYTICNFLLSLPSPVFSEDFHWASVCVELVTTFVGCFEIGLVEESIWRVLSINLLLWVFGEDKKGKYTAILVSSALFGLSHINNLIQTPGIVNKTISQVIYAFILGLFFAIVYVKSHSILPSIVHHALYDFACYGAYCFYPKDLLQETVTTDSSFASAMYETALHLPILIYSILLLTGGWERIVQKGKSLLSKRLTGSGKTD